ncbi:MAG: ATP-binding protein [Lentimicrobiaceae bacterium]|nr:ATP-binding protein [Lentimicrobiaceae bacterium]
MYISREIDKQLNEWKESKQHKPLLLRGARQVGKSSVVRHLGESFDYYIEANFEKKSELKDLFKQTTDVKLLASNIGLLYNTPIIAGKTLLFLDEIQVSSEAIKSLWFFKEDFPELHIIAAGSLLEFTLKDLASFGVGRIRSLFMYPFSFDEFLIAQGKKDWVEAKQMADAEKPLFEALHNELVQQFRTFLIVGGMPASVVAWLDSHNYNECQAELDDIQLSYYDDFAKYSNKVDTTLLRNTLQSVVAQTGKKFMYSKVEGGYRTDDVKNALRMLCDAGIIKRVSHTAANGLPLGAEVNDKFRKYIYLDSALLLRILDLNFGASQNIVDTIVAGTAEDLVNKGGLAEMILGWELVKYSSSRSQHDLFYWENTSENTTSEVDYIIVRNMKVVPIECKSGKSGKMKSLRLFMKNKHIKEAIRCSLENFALLQNNEDKSENEVSNICINPLYAVSNIINDIPK